MRLHETEKGIPFITFEEEEVNGSLYFVPLTSSQRGYKHLRYKYYAITELSTSKKPSKRAKTVTFGDDISFTCDMEIMRGTGTSRKGPPRGTIPIPVSRVLREIIKKYVDKDGIFPYDRINELKLELNGPEKIETTHTVNISSSKAERIKKKTKRVMKKKSKKKRKKKKRKKK